MTKKLISFCIPTYNRSSCLVKCIESLIGYRNDDIEIIIQDNCSPDSTEEVVKSYNDHRIRYYKNTSNVGVRLNIRTIIDRAKGEYIFFLTDDDMLIPGAIHSIKDYILKNDLSVFQSDTITFLEKSNKSYVYSAIKSTKSNCELTKKEKAGIIIFSHVLTGLCFRKDDVDFSFYDKNIDHWYPSILITGLLSNNMGYLAEPITIHTWENELFWGIDNKSKELAISETKSITSLEEKMDEELFRILIKQYILSSGIQKVCLTSKISFIENIIITMQLMKIRLYRFISKFLLFIKNQI
jgi:glycosyltransferase involved in cell wall biosynthesis